MPSLIPLKCLSSCQGRALLPGWPLGPPQVAGSPSVRDRRSPSPQGACALGAVLRAQIHRYTVGKGQRLFLCGDCGVTGSAHSASLCFSFSFYEKRTNSGQPCEDSVKKCLHRAWRSPVWQKTPGLGAQGCKFSSPTAA